MHKMTEQNLGNAFVGESQARMRYTIFSEVAEKEGKPNIARLFRAVAYAEAVHATNHLNVLGGTKSTVDNLDSAVSGEAFEVQEMYPAYLKEAQDQGEEEAQKVTHYALEAEKIHLQMYKKAKEAALSGKDLDLGDVYICPVCGYTGEGQAPDFCPICGAKKETLRQF